MKQNSLLTSGHNRLLPRRQAILGCCIRKRAVHVFPSLRFYADIGFSRLLVPAEMSTMWLSSVCRRSRACMWAVLHSWICLLSPWPGLFPRTSRHFCFVVFPADSAGIQTCSSLRDTPEGLGRWSPRHSRKSDPGVLLDLISSLQHHYLLFKAKMVPESQPVCFSESCHSFLPGCTTKCHVHCFNCKSSKPSLENCWRGLTQDCLCFCNAVFMIFLFFNCKLLGVKSSLIST